MVACRIKLKVSDCTTLGKLSIPNWYSVVSIMNENIAIEIAK